MVVQTAKVAQPPVEVKPKASAEKQEESSEFSNLVSKAVAQKKSTETKVETKENRTEADSKNTQEETADQMVSIVQTSDVNLLLSIAPIIAQAVNSSETVTTANTQAQAVTGIVAAVNSGEAITNANAQAQTITDIAVTVKPMVQASQEAITPQVQQEQADLQSQPLIQAQNAETQGSVNEVQTPAQSSSPQQVADFASQVQEHLTKETTPNQKLDVNVQDTKAQNGGSTNSEQKVSTETNTEQNLQVNTSEQTQTQNATTVVSELAQKKAKEPVKADDAKNAELPVDKVVGSDLKTNQADFTQAVKETVNKELPMQREVVNQVVKQLESNFNAKTSEFNFNLYPENLGKVAVKMAVEDGMLVIEIAATNAKTQSILAANANEIKTMLQQHSTQQQFVDASSNPQAHDYLRDNSPNQENNQGREQGDENQANKENAEPSTADFLSVMQLVTIAKKSESW